MEIDRALKPREIKEKFPDFNAKTMETGWAVYDILLIPLLSVKKEKGSEMSLEDQMKKELLSYGIC